MATLFLTQQEVRRGEVRSAKPKKETLTFGLVADGRITFLSKEDTILRHATAILIE